MPWKIVWLSGRLASPLCEPIYANAVGLSKHYTQLALHIQEFRQIFSDANTRAIHKWPPFVSIYLQGKYSIKQSLGLLQIMHLRLHNAELLCMGMGTIGHPRENQQKIGQIRTQDCMPCWFAPEPDQEVDQSEFRVVSTQSAQGPIQCILMRWSIHALVNLPNCLGMLVSRIAKHAFEILEPLLQEPIDGRTSHDDQTRFIWQGVASTQSVHVC